MSEHRVASDLGQDAASPYRFAVVVSVFNEAITTRLCEAAVATLTQHGAVSDRIRVIRVPGAYELPMAAHRLAVAGEVDAVVCLGALVRGETAHFDVLAHSTASAIQDAARATGIPISFGVITCDSIEQAETRAGGECGNKGAEAALAAIQMAILYAETPAFRPPSTEC